MQQMLTYYLYCDGGSRAKFGLASFGAVALDPNGEPYQDLTMKRGFSGKTNNQMELLGFIEGITALISRHIETNPHEFATFRVVSDSKYLVQGITEYLPVWRTNGWKTYSKKPVKNLDLWHIIDDILKTLDSLKLYLDIQWTKGHAQATSTDSYYNEICDRLCNEAMDDFQPSDFAERKSVGFQRLIKLCEEVYWNE